MELNHIIEVVRTAKQKNDFFLCPFPIYALMPAWVSPLKMMIDKVFAEKKNSFFQQGQAQRWIARNEKGEVIGRIAAFYHKEKFVKDKKSIGAMGFFESIWDKKVAFSLFSTAEKWLKDKGFNTYMAPVNFGENDMFWGLQTQGFEQYSNFGMNYNPLYYVDFFQQYGFKEAYSQLTNSISITKGLPKRFTKIALWVKKRSQFTFKHIKFNNLKKYAEDFISIYNDAWQGFENFSLLKSEMILERMQEMRVFSKEPLNIFAYDNGKPIAFVLLMEDGNLWFKDAKGRLSLWKKLKLYFKLHKRSPRLRAIVLGVKKKYQNKGIESVMFHLLEQYTLKHPEYKILDLSWVGDFNQPMINIHEALDGKVVKIHKTYYKTID